MEKEYRVIGGRYLLKKKIGQGGSGFVYLCHDNKLHKDWAAKELTKTADVERSMELELLKTISCNAFPRIVDVVKEEGNFYLIMDYIEGVSLKDKMKQQLLTESDVLPWALDIARGIQKHAESNGFSVVRDLCGHGIGRNLHEDPQILNYVTFILNIVVPILNLPHLLISRKDYKRNS